MLHFEDREFEISLAKLQAEIQIDTSAAFGFIAATLALSAMGIQVLTILSIEPARTAIFIVELVAILTLVAGSVYFLHGATLARDQIEELREKYVF